MISERSLSAIYPYLAYALAAILFLISVFTLNPYAVALVSILMLASIVYLNSGHIINSLLIKNLGIIEIKNEYKLGKNLLSATKKSEGQYISFSLAALQITKKPSEPYRIMEEMLEKVRIPFEFSIGLRAIDGKEVTEKLETARRMKEISLSQVESTDYKRINKIKRELNVIENDLSLVTGGDSPFEVLMRLKTSAVSESEGEALRQSARQIEYLCGIFSSSLNLKYDIIRGEELLEQL